MFNCQFTKIHLSAIGLGSFHDHWQDITDNDFLNSINNIRKYKGNFDLLCFLWWAIWSYRNNIIFRQASQNNSQNIINQARNSYQNWFNEFKPKRFIHEQSCHRPLVSWTKPPPNILKINFDGSYKIGREGQIGITLRDCKGSNIHSYSEKINSNSALFSEASALLAGLRLALSLGFRKVIAEGDNINIINVTNNIWSTPWSIRDTIEDIKEEVKKFDYIKISHCFREGNRAADFLASKLNYNMRCICNPSHRDFLTIIRQDVLGYTFARRIV